jgi:hypothetical protein
MVDRPLTAGERQMVFAKFGDSFNLDGARVTDQVAFSGQDVPAVPTGQKLYWPEGMTGRPYSDDFSTESPEIQGDFMHEMTHIWQNQHGEQTNTLLFEYAKRGQATYDLSGVTPNSPWGSLNLDQQAEVVKNIQILENGGTVTNGTLSLEQYRAILGRSPWHIEAPRDPPQTPDPSPGCFVRGTPILLADGTSKPIEQINIGDLVLAFDKDASLMPRRVIRLFENTRNRRFYSENERYENTLVIRASIVSVARDSRKFHEKEPQL